MTDKINEKSCITAVLRQTVDFHGTQAQEAHRTGRKSKPEGVL